jgi:hypothetical protein
MFNRNKLAAGVIFALSAATPHAFGANTVVTTETTHSAEGAGTVTTYGTAASKMTLDQNYVVNDELWVTLSQAASSATKFPATLTCLLSNTATNNNAVDTCTLSRYSNTTTVGKYRFTAFTDGDNATPKDGTSTINGTVNMPAVTGMTHNSAATTITWHTQNSSGGIIDSDVTDTAATFNLDEISIPATPTKAWNAIIDVDSALKKFTAGNDSTLTDVATYTVTSDAGTTLDADITGYTVVVKGDMSWLDAGATADTVDINAATHGKLQFDTGGTGTCTTFAASVFNAAMDTYTVQCTSAAANDGDNAAATDVITGTWTLGSAPNAMTARSYTVDITTKYDTEANVASTEANVVGGAIGSWTENTANITAYAVPMTSSVTRMLWIANSGAAAATVSATVEAGGVTYGPYTMDSVAAKSTLGVGQALDTKLAADAAWTAAGYTSRANIAFAVGASSAVVELSAGYYSTTDKDRQTLETSQTQ